MRGAPSSVAAGVFVGVTVRRRLRGRRRSSPVSIGVASSASSASPSRRAVVGVRLIKDSFVIIQSVCSTRTARGSKAACSPPVAPGVLGLGAPKHTAPPGLRRTRAYGQTAAPSDRDEAVSLTYARAVARSTASKPQSPLHGRTHATRSVVVRGSRLDTQTKQDRTKKRARGRVPRASERQFPQIF